MAGQGVGVPQGRAGVGCSGGGLWREGAGVVGAPWRIRGGDEGGGAAALVLVMLAQAEGGFFGGGSEAYWVSLSCALHFCCSPCPVQTRLGPLLHPWHPFSHGLLLPRPPAHFVAKSSCLCSLSPLPLQGLTHPSSGYVLPPCPQMTLSLSFVFAELWEAQH